MSDTPTDDVLLDADGAPADKKAEFELRRKVIGRVVKGIRFCSNDVYSFVDDADSETVRRGSTLVLAFDGGGDLIVAASDTGGMELFLANQKDPHGQPDEWIGTQKVN